MKTLKLSIIIILIGILPIEIFAWDGMPTPPLHIEGRWLKDPTGKNVILHGWFQAGGWWFNGKLFNDPTTFTPADCAEALKYYKAQAELLTDTSRLFGYNHGWYNSFVRFFLPSEGWDTTGLVNGSLVDNAINNLVVPYIEYCKSRGLYVVLCGNAQSGANYMSATHKSNLMKYWKRMASYPGIKNADNVMFEICNEPVVIESVLGNGQWGSSDDAHDKAIQIFMQDICDTIRSTGSDNIIWVPGLIWQQRLAGFVKFPVTGNNISYTGHRYPFGANDAQNIIDNFNSDFKICSDKYPIIITEESWHTMGSDQGIRTGTTEVFGETIRNLFDKAGNISWMVGFNTEIISGIDEGKQPDEWGYPPINSGRAGFDWWPSYTWCAPDDGTPKYMYASVNASNSKQIKITMSEPLVDSSYFDGFTVKIDDQIVTIDSVVLGDTNQLVINLNVNVLKENKILLSYKDGNVVSIYEKYLKEFNDTLVENLLKGASPRITELKTNKDGDTLIAKFNMKIMLPSDISTLVLNAEYNGNINIPVSQYSFLNSDSTLLVFSLSKQVYADYKLLLSYSGNNIISSDSGLLKAFSDYPVINNSNGLPVQIDTGRLAADGLSGTMEFSKPLALIIKQSAFTINVNKKSVSYSDIYSLNNIIRFTLPGALHYGDTITVSYTPGDVTATDGGILKGFSNYPITNLVNEPKWISVPGRVEAEKFYSQFGTSTENTSDTGGGLNVGWIDNGDWLEYGMENSTSVTSCEITFRIASPNSNTQFDYYLDNVKKGTVAVPNTGSWQTWQSVVKNITIDPGKHYFKVVAATGGFNINYFDIKASAYLSSKTSKDGKIIAVAFNTKMADTSVLISNFTVKGNNVNNVVTQASLNGTKDTLFLTLKNQIVKSTDVITVTYQPGTLSTIEGSLVAGFNAKPVTNLVLVPSFVSAATSSDGATIQVNFSQVMASPAGQESAFTITVNSKNNQVTDAALSDTNNKSIILTLSSGIYYGDTVAVSYTPGALVSSAGVPVSVFSSQVTNKSTIVTAIENIINYSIRCYPNPVSSELIIGSAGFHYDKVEIIDITGKTVLSRLTAYEPDLHIPVNLPNGTYVVKISNGKQTYLKKIIIDKN